MKIYYPQICKQCPLLNPMNPFQEVKTHSHGDNQVSVSHTGIRIQQLIQGVKVWKP